MVLEEEKQQQKKLKMSHLASTPLPNEIIVEILLKLRVGSLLRCKSVCKSWQSLISDPYFIKSHLSLLTRDPHYAHHRLITRTEFKSCSLYDVMFGKYINVLELSDSFKQICKSDVVSNSYSRLICGSCDGLLCVYVNQNTLLIWNPGTGRSNIVPLKTQVGWFASYGFGYDESTNDYKVVEISWCYNTSGEFDKEVNIYSLKIGNWKRISDFPCKCPPSSNPGKFSNGSLHWAAGKDNGSSRSWTIISLDLAKERFSETSQPVYDEGDKILTLCALGEYLCVFCKYHGRGVADVWVMKAYGVKKCWTKFVSIPYIHHTRRHQVVTPLSISNDGKVLLIRISEKLRLYDSKNSTYSEIQEFANCSTAFTFVESLVSPDAL